MRIIDWSAQDKTIAASTTIIWSGNDLPATRVCAYHVHLAGNAANIGTNVDRVRLKARGASIFDVTGAQLLAFNQAWSPGNFNAAGADFTFTIPLYDGSRPTEEEQDESQFPEGETAQLEVTFNGSAAAGQALLGWTLTDQDAQYFPRILSQAHNVANGAVNQRVAFSTTGLLRGLCLPVTGLTRVKVQAGLARPQGIQDVKLFDASGSDWDTAATSGNMALESQRWRNAGATTSDPLWMFWKTGAMAVPGRTYLELQTDGGGTWVGTGEFAVFEQLPQLR